MSTLSDAAGDVTGPSLVSQVTAEVQRRMAGQQAGHGFDHVQRVVLSAMQIQKEVGGEPLVIQLAALLHDVGDAKFHDGQERSGEFAAQILGGMAANPSLIEHVVHIVDNISFRKREQSEALSLEGKVVQDADRLDALGAIGIVRTIEYGHAKGQPFFDPNHPEGPSGVSHFFEKLFKLRDLMNTSAGKKLAEEREATMRAFLEQYFAEVGVASNRFPL